MDYTSKLWIPYILKNHPYKSHREIAKATERENGMKWYDLHNAIPEPCEYFFYGKVHHLAHKNNI